MDACSAFIFLGSGRGSLNTQEYISKLLGQATIDKRTEGESRGKSGSSSLNFDRAGRDLMTPAEIGRMPREKSIILLEGQQPVLNDKVRPFAVFWVNFPKLSQNVSCQYSFSIPVIMEIQDNS